MTWTPFEHVDRGWVAELEDGYASVEAAGKDGDGNDVIWSWECGTGSSEAYGTAPAPLAAKARALEVLAVLFRLEGTEGS